MRHSTLPVQAAIFRRAPARRRAEEWQVPPMVSEDILVIQERLDTPFLSHQGFCVNLDIKKKGIHFSTAAG